MVDVEHRCLCALEEDVLVGVIRNANFTKDFTLNTSNIEYLDVEERQYKSRKLEKGDLIVEKSGGSEKQPVGRTILFDLEGDFSVSNFTSILRLKDKNAILPAFLYKYLLFVYKLQYLDYADYVLHQL